MRGSGDEPVVWHNGQFIPESSPAIQASDPGFLCGHGLYETILVANGNPFALNLHLARLRTAADLIGLTPPKSTLLSQAVTELIDANRFDHARIRITISIDTGPLFDNAMGVPASVVVSGAIVSRSPVEPALLITVPFPRNDQSPLTGVKSTSYSENIVAYRFARKKGGTEALFYNTRNELCEGSRSNVFLVNGESITTPPVSSGCLPGVTRCLVLDLARDLGIRADEDALSKRDLEETSEMFITSSIRGVQPVGALDDRSFAGTPGPVTRRIQEAYSDLLEKETR